MAFILLIEDDPDTAPAVQDMLEALGHQVRWIQNGQEALQAAGERRPDLVLTDILMPDMDGIEVVLAFGQAFAGLPLLAMSAQTEAPYLRAAKTLGACGTLAKPFGVEELRKAMASALPGR